MLMCEARTVLDSKEFVISLIHIFAEFTGIESMQAVRLVEQNIDGAGR